MNKKQCREALDLYKKFLIRMDRVGEFLKVAEVSWVFTYTNYASFGRFSEMINSCYFVLECWHW